MGSYGESKVRLLPLIGTPGSHSGGRSPLACRFRCGDACFHEVPNTSDNPYVGDVIAGAPQAQAAEAAGAADASATAHAAHTTDKAGRGLRFSPVASNTADAVTVPDG